MLTSKQLISVAEFGDSLSQLHHSIRLNLEPTLLISTLTGSVQGSANTIGLNKFEKTTAIVSQYNRYRSSRNALGGWSFHYSIPFHSTVPFHRSIPLNKDTQLNLYDSSSLGGGGGGGGGARLIFVMGIGLSRVYMGQEYEARDRMGLPHILGCGPNPGTWTRPRTDSGCLPHRLENEAAEFDSTFLQARPGLMAARSALPSAGLEKSEGTPRKGRAHLACTWLPDY